MFRRLANFFKGILALFIGGLESSNPRALIEAEKENLRSQISRFNEGLAQHAAMCERLGRQVKQLDAKEKELTAKITANLKVGNKAVAGQMALQLQDAKKQLTENREQLAMAEKTFKDLERSRDVSVREAQAKIQKLQSMISETEMAEAQAELQTMAKGMITTIGGGGDTLNRVEEQLAKRRDEAVGAARVANGMVDTTEVNLKENEQAALADQALAEFAAMQGIDMGSSASTPATPQPVPTEKVMGPQ